MPDGALILTVRDNDTGSVIENASVVVFGWDATAGDYVEVNSGTTNADGVYTSGVIPENDYLVEVTADGYFRGAPYIYVSGDTPYDLSLLPGTNGTITIHVTDGTSPITDAAVQITQWNSDRHVYVPIDSGATDSSGTFVTASLSPGDYQIDVVKDGYFAGQASASG